ncbi:uncharacterized protein LOC143881444 [Tasmannia lanceolata]|uniref:uncharacterized protein LOC143881444 n=1 Tax=Tasmannia lanceolata TaxID=3420 RepID=UPI00406310EB
MDFFKSVFSDDLEPSLTQKSKSESPTNPNPNPNPNFSREVEDRLEADPGQKIQFNEQNPNPNPNSSGGGGGWGFGGLIKTFASKSESILETYRRDLEEFRCGLKKETVVIREVASRVVKELPYSLETGASVAQESIESVGQAIDEYGSSVWRGTTDIISDITHDHDSDSSDAQNVSSSTLNSKRYSRFEAQVVGIQSDSNTYCEEPDDLDDFKQWKLGFSLAEKGEEIMNLCSENAVVEGMFSNLVPNVVDHEMFWTRYFYRVHKLKQVEDARANLVKRAISRENEEELSWEVDDDEEETNVLESKNDLPENRELEKEEKPIDVLQVEPAQVVADTEEKSSDSKPSDKNSVAKPTSSQESNGKLLSEGKAELAGTTSDDSVEKSNDKMFLKGKSDPGELSKHSDFSVVSSQPSVQEDDDLGWDEIEDLGSSDENKVTSGGSPTRVDFCKRLSAADEEEDLTWDIEDDEPVKQ